MGVKTDLNLSDMKLEDFYQGFHSNGDVSLPGMSVYWGCYSTGDVTLLELVFNKSLILMDVSLIKQILRAFSDVFT